MRHMSIIPINMGFYQADLAISKATSGQANLLGPPGDFIRAICWQDKVLGDEQYDTKQRAFFAARRTEDFAAWTLECGRLLTGWLKTYLGEQT